MARVQSLNDHCPTTTQINITHRKGVRQICSSTDLTPAEKLNRVKSYLKNVRKVGAILLVGNQIQIHTGGILNSTYTYSV